MYIFGGKDEENNKLNDTWKFNFNTREWTEIECFDSPRPRSGHSASIYNEKFMIIYGGIEEITKELNDLHIFNLHENKWMCLFEEINSPKRIRDDKMNESVAKKATMRVSKIDPNAMQGLSIKPDMSDKKKKTGSPSKKKVIPLRKEEERVVELESPTSTSMKNSFLIKNADPSFDKSYAQIKKRTMEKTHVESFDNTISKTAGKRPPARDGHTGIIVNDSFFVFGGDRHHMPFNDFHMLDLKAEFEM